MRRNANKPLKVCNSGSHRRIYSRCGLRITRFSVYSRSCVPPTHHHLRPRGVSISSRLTSVNLFVLRFNMRTRNADTTPKSGPKKATAKKTPPKPSEASPAETVVATPKSGSSTTTKQTKRTVTPKIEPKVIDLVVEDASASVEASQVTPETKAAPATKSAGKKVGKSPAGRVVKTPKLVEAVVKKSQKMEEPPAVVNLEEEALNKEEASVKNEEQVVFTRVDEAPRGEEPAVSIVVVEVLKKEQPDVSNTMAEVLKEEEPVVVANVPVEVLKMEEIEPKVMEQVKEVKEDAAPVVLGKGEVVPVKDVNEPEDQPVDMEKDSKEDVEEKGIQPVGEEQNAADGMEDYGELEGFEEPGDEECAQDDMSEPEEEAGRLEVEHMEISALAKERRAKKEQEIFVGGLDRDAVEDDIKKVFEKIGDVVEVRLHKNPVTNKNKGYAFVKFANKELASRALSELKNPIIRGKRCGIAPSEDNDTLFIGNICNTWTKEAIKQKMKEYGLEGVENVTLVSDAHHEGLSRGFAFVEFSCHADAMIAYKRLQKPDAVFGHPERTVKVAFAEPLREPDPEVMAQVKSVFVDGLPPHWDEERVREQFKQYGEIERIVLARNMPTAKRKDFGFVDFNTHDAAIACIDGLNNTELGDERSKARVKVRLSNPLPKTQAVKGGLCGGFRIGRGAGTGFSRYGRGFVRGGNGHGMGRGSFQRGKDFHARGRGRTGRYPFPPDSYIEGPFSGFYGREQFGGRGGRRGYEEEFAGSDFGRSWQPADRGRGRSFQSRRQPFASEGHYGQPIDGRYFADDPYLYDESAHGMKRPYSMMDREPGYLEPSRLRPRFDHPDPMYPSHETRYHDSFGAGSSLYSRDYYSSAYGGSTFSSAYGAERPFGGRYYY